MTFVPRISVVVIAYNAEPYITQTLETIVSQSYPDFEVIVVDDGSTDGTRACVARFGSAVKYVYQKNSGGCSKPRNTGIAHATGELLAFIDSDDLMVAGRLAAEAAVFARNPEVALVFSDYQDFDASGVDDTGHFAT